MNTTDLNPQELSSRKLWRLAESARESKISDQELSNVIAELARRRHNLEKLGEIGKLGAQPTN